MTTNVDSSQETTEQRELRNSIFAAQQAAEKAGGKSPIQGQSGQDMNNPVSRARNSSQQAAADTDIEIEVGDVPLPSSGLLYQPGHPLHDAQTAQVRNMSTQDEDILMNRTLVRKGTVITELIKACLINKDIEPNQLISGDRNALMIAIRIMGYGETYRPKIDCPKCNVSQIWPVDLTQLKLKELNLNKATQTDQWCNEFQTTLPITKKKVYFKFLTGKEEEEILADMEARRKKGILAENVITTRLKHSVVAIDSNRSKDFIARICQKLPARDSLFLRKHIDSVEPGIEMKFDFSCVNNECEHTDYMVIPMTSEFFWPAEE